MRPDDAYLMDMLLAARKVQQFTRAATRQQFDGDEVLQNAVMRQVQIIGEAAWRVSAEFQNSHPEIPWKGIMGIRHRLVHDYFSIDVSRVWDVVETDIAELIGWLLPLLPAPPDEEPK